MFVHGERTKRRENKKEKDELVEVGSNHCCGLFKKKRRANNRWIEGKV